MRRVWKRKMEKARGRKLMVALEDGEKDIYALEWALNCLVPRPNCNAGPDHFVIFCLTTQPQSPSRTHRKGDSLASHLLAGEEEKHKAIIDRVKHACEKHDVTYEIKIAEGEAKVIICEAAKTLGVDILVINNRGHGWLKRLFSWSGIVDSCIPNVSCPVVVVKGRGNSAVN